MHAFRTAAVAVLVLGIAAARAPVAAQQRAQRNMSSSSSPTASAGRSLPRSHTALINEEHGQVEDTAALRRDFAVGSPVENRRALLPFLWDSVARNGQLYGNRDLGSAAQVTNGLKFSYPGYNEMLTGRADPRIDRNSYGPNPNVTVFEWLGHQPGFEGGSRPRIVGRLRRDLQPEPGGYSCPCRVETPFPTRRRRNPGCSTGCMPRRPASGTG
jgi:hypothetical protein